MSVKLLARNISGQQEGRGRGHVQAEWEDEESQLTMSAMAPKARQLAASISMVPLFLSVLMTFI